MPHPSIWQENIDPVLLARLLRPLEAPGVISLELARRILGWAGYFSRRLPLLEGLARRQGRTGGLRVDAVPIVHGRWLPVPATEGAPPTALPGTRELIVVRTPLVASMGESVADSAPGAPGAGPRAREEEQPRVIAPSRPGGRAQPPSSAPPVLPGSLTLPLAGLAPRVVPVPPPTRQSEPRAATAPASPPLAPASPPLAPASPPLAPASPSLAPASPSVPRNALLSAPRPPATAPQAPLVPLSLPERHEPAASGGTPSAAPPVVQRPSHELPAPPSSTPAAPLLVHLPARALVAPQQAFPMATPLPRPKRRVVTPQTSLQRVSSAPLPPPSTPPLPRVAPLRQAGPANTPPTAESLPHLRVANAPTPDGPVSRPHGADSALEAPMSMASHPPRLAPDLMAPAPPAPGLPVPANVMAPGLQRSPLPPPSPSSAVDIDLLVDKVQRKLLHRLAVERERKGGTR